MSTLNKSEFTKKVKVDFNLNESLTMYSVQNGKIGQIILNNHSTDVSYDDLTNLIDVLSAAKDVIYKKIKLGQIK